MNALEDRRRALEEAFFRKEDARLRERLRERMEEERDAEALARACGMKAQAPLLKPLVHEGVTVETLPALFLVPLVAVAWANDAVTATERLELLSHARALGVEPGSASHELLEGWLERRPPQRLFEAWNAYAEALASALDAEQRSAFADEVLWRAREVARADGGVLRIGRRVSEAESGVLTELERVFSR